MDPGATEPLANLTLIYGRMDRIQAVEPLYLRALQAMPENPALHAAYARLQLQHGRFAEGWAAYDWRLKTEAFRSPLAEADTPIWDGAALGKRRLLVWADSGPAEQILFSTVLSDLAWLGGSVTVSCDPSLAPLLARSFERFTIVPSDALEADAADFDCQIALGSLPGLFRGAEVDFPNRRAVLSPDGDRVAKLGASAMRRAKGRQLVGLAWQATDDGAAPPVDAWQSILGTDGCRVHNLQAMEGEPRGWPAPAEVLSDRRDEPSPNLDELAAQMAAYDLVITADNALAHLAAAVGARTWLVLPKMSRWYWMLERDDSPWYPALRLFRQANTDDWGSLMADVATALEGFVRTGDA